MINRTLIDEILRHAIDYPIPGYGRCVMVSDIEAVLKCADYCARCGYYRRRHKGKARTCPHTMDYGHPSTFLPRTEENMRKVKNGET